MGKELIHIEYEKSIKRVNFFLKLTGVYINADDAERTLKQRLWNRLFYCINIVWANYDCFSTFGVWPALSMREITRMIPCFTLCQLANVKSFYFISYHHHVINLIKTLKTLQSMKPLQKDVEQEMVKKRLPFLYLTNNILLMLGITGIATFFLGSALFTLLHYLKTNEIELILPFFVWYPFDVYSLKFWPFVYVHEFWSAWVTLFLVYGTDCFFCTICVFIHLQFQSLKLDMQNIAECFTPGGKVTDEFKMLIHRHREIIRCVKLLDTIYGKSNLFNAFSSSLIICVTGFNIMVIDDYITMAPFTPFLTLGSLQIFLFCYYGDLFMRDSLDISEAVYNSEWYKLDAASMKYCLFMMMRSQKPVTVTAYGFADINLRAFTGILKSSWSYFTLLKTVYVNKSN